MVEPVHYFRLLSALHRIGVPGNRNPETDINKYVIYYFIIIIVYIDIAIIIDIIMVIIRISQTS